MTLPRLAALLQGAARGSFPEPDGSVEVLPPPAGPAMAVVAFTAHHVPHGGGTRLASPGRPGDRPPRRRARFFEDRGGAPVVILGRGLAERPIGSEALFF